MTPLYRRLGVCSSRAYAVCAMLPVVWNNHLPTYRWDTYMKRQKRYRTSLVVRQRRAYDLRAVRCASGARDHKRSVCDLLTPRNRQLAYRILKGGDVILYRVSPLAGWNVQAGDRRGRVLSHCWHRAAPITIISSPIRTCAHAVPPRLRGSARAAHAA